MVNVRFTYVNGRFEKYTFTRMCFKIHFEKNLMHAFKGSFYTPRKQSLWGK